MLKEVRIRLVKTVSCEIVLSEENGDTIPINSQEIIDLSKRIENNIKNFMDDGDEWIEGDLKVESVEYIDG